MLRSIWVATLMFLASAAALISPASAAPATVTGYVDAGDGVRLFYERIGSGPNIVVVPLRTFTMAGLKGLARPDRTLIFYDVRNRGASSAVARDDLISIQADVADVEAIRRHFRARKISLMGYSYTGLMVVLYALRRPSHVNRIVQLGPVPIKYGTNFPSQFVWTDSVSVIAPAAADEILALRAQGYDRSNPKDYCLRFNRQMRLRLVGNPANASMIDVEETCRHENEWSPSLARHLRLHFEGSVQNLEVSRQAAGALRTPVLTLHGTMDRNAPFAAGAEWAIALPNARLIPVPGAAHQLWVEDARALTDIDRFLGGKWPERAARVRNWAEVGKLLPSGKL